jgi:hypothetical protein
MMDFCIRGFEATRELDTEHKDDACTRDTSSRLRNGRIVSVTMQTILGSECEASNGSFGRWVERWTRAAYVTRTDIWQGSIVT